MATKAQVERRRRIKIACETIEDELNRLTTDDWADAVVADAMHIVIRHLKWRWVEVNAGAAATRQESAGRTGGGAHEE